KKFPDARQHAELVLKGDPRNAQAQIFVANADAEEGNLSKALEEAQKAVDMDVNRAPSYLSLALLQERNQDAPAAERSLQKALALDPKSTPARLALGYLYENQKRWDDAEEQFRAGLTLDPKDPISSAALARLYLNEGQKNKAEQVLQDAKATFKDNPAGYRMLGDYYLSQGESDKAATEFASLHSEHPNDLAVAKTYIGILVLRNQLDEATRLNDAILKNSPGDTDSLVLRGQILIRQGKASDAIPILASAVKAAPDNPLAHYHLGAAYAATLNFGQAQSEWLEAARLRPRMVEPQRALATLAARNGDLSLLADSSEELIKLEPHSAEGYVFHARALFSKGDLAGAEADLKKAMEVAPGDPIPYVRMGDLRVARKQLDEAGKLYGQALTLNPSAVDALTGLVNIDLERKQAAKALRRIQEQIARVPNNSNLYLLLGQVELRNQDSVHAEEAFEKAVDLDKNNVPAFLLLASVQLSRGSVDQAIAGYQRALAANPSDVRILVALGSLLEARNDWQKAEELYQKALQIQPDYPVAANNLAYLMLSHGGNINVALSLAQTARRGLPNLPNSADTLGWAYYQQGVYNAAIETLQQAVQGEPKNPTYHYHLGLAYQKANNYAMAKKQFEYTLEISPDYSQAAEIKKLLAQSPQNH
ncbi:MAG TPA: tetratricopeptide repeat protein, partial [Candidatus Polarisedimenticolia bacterium]|nr:tetratricopeptide repeat protein [Candidatus Polarisedimenticolia bacterium]